MFEQAPFPKLDTVIPGQIQPALGNAQVKEQTKPILLEYMIVLGFVVFLLMAVYTQDRGTWNLLTKNLEQTAHSLGTKCLLFFNGT